MQAAPPSPSGPRIDEQGGTLVVTFRPRRSGLGFLGFWLVGWTFAGIGAMGSIAGASGGNRGFLLSWLCGWFFGEAAVVSLIAWKIAGRELLTVTANELEVRRQLGRLAIPTGRVHVLAIEDVRAERVPTGEDERPRKDFRLRIVSQGRPELRAGEGMDERTAEHVVSVVRAHVHPRWEWSDDETEYGVARPQDPRPAAEDAEPALDRDRHPWVGPALFVGIIVTIVVVNVAPRLHHHTPRLLPRLDSPATATVGTPPTGLAGSADVPPRRAQFDDPHAFAVAMTRYSLKAGWETIESAPSCTTADGWKHWTCRARARSRDGVFAGRSLVYRCWVVDNPQVSDPGALETDCGPEHPPPITP